MGQADVSLGVRLVVWLPHAPGAVALGPGGERALGHSACDLNHFRSADCPNNLPFFAGCLWRTVCHRTQLHICKLKTVPNNSRRTQEVLLLFRCSVVLYQNIET